MALSMLDFIQSFVPFRKIGCAQQTLHTITHTHTYMRKTNDGNGENVHKIEINKDHKFFIPPHSVDCEWGMYSNFCNGYYYLFDRHVFIVNTAK